MLFVIVNLTDWTICNQKLIQLDTIEIIRGNCPTSLITAKLHALELTPGSYLRNLIIFLYVLSNSFVFLMSTQTVPLPSIPLKEYSYPDHISLLYKAMGFTKESKMFKIADG